MPSAENSPRLAQTVDSFRQLTIIYPNRTKYRQGVPVALQRRSKMPVFPVNALRTRLPLDFIRTVISFTVTRDA